MREIRHSRKLRGSCGAKNHYGGVEQWLFGFRPLSEIAAEEGRMDGTDLPAWTKDVRPIDGVFLDEVV